MNKIIYLDYNATTPHHPAVVKAMLPFLHNEFGNPSSSHLYGKKPEKAVNKARKQVAGMLNCKPDEIIFTSGGTESNNFAIKSLCFDKIKYGNHIITSAIEHPAVLAVCATLTTIGFKVTQIPVDSYGMINPVDVKNAIRPETILISIMHSNNEVGTLQPIAAISKIARDKGITMHTDAAQSPGKVVLDVQKIPIDLLSIAGHKLYGPKGVGALFIRKNHPLSPFLHGAGQESGKRGGTENVLGIVGLGKACELADYESKNNWKHLHKCRQRLLHGLQKQFGKSIRLNGHPSKHLPNTLSISFKHLNATHILQEINTKIAASAGAACHADNIMISHVLQAIGIPKKWAKGTLRFSTGRTTTYQEIDKALACITTAINKLRSYD